MKIAPRALVACCAVVTASVSSLSAQTLTSIDFTPLEGTSWGESSVRLDFGDGIGLGTVSFSSLNSGGYTIVAPGTPYNAAPYSSYNGPTTLGNGAIFNPAEEVIFRIQPGGSPGLSGFRMTVALDSGMFPEGSVFAIRSLGLNAAGAYQSLTLVSGLESADSVQLPSDDAWGTPPDFVETGIGVYQAASVGSNAKGRAFEINGGSFTVDLVGNYVGGGEAFTIAVAPVPEPTPLALGIAGLGGFLLLRRRL